MFDVGWSELLLIGIVALIVVGPKDLPHLFHALGRFTAKARSMAREFSSAMEDAARESGVDDATKSLRDLKSLTSKKSLGLDALDRAADRFEKWDPAMPTKRGGPQRDPDAPAPTADTAAPAPVPVPAPQPAASEATGTGGAGTTGDAGTTSAGVGGAQTAPAGNGRRIHAVRRSDMKDR